MAKTTILSLQVSDIVQWYRNEELIINEVFQRRSVWSSTAKTYLIDTILNGMPIPKIYIRTRVDPVTQKSLREVVDGQQRIRALVDFANDELRLGKRSNDFNKLRYSDLDEESQERFLGYVITTEQLLNADDQAVLEIFARLNSYTVSLNAAEKRHAEFQSEFKFAVRESAQKWSRFLDDKKILSLKQRFRMRDDELVAEMYRVLVEGVCDGGDKNLRKFYKMMDDDEFSGANARRLHSRLNECLRFLDERIDDAITGKLANPALVLMMFAAYCHHAFSIPKGDIERMPRRKKLAKSALIRERLRELQDAIEADEPPSAHSEFVQMPRKTSPVRIAARRIRFNKMVQIFGA